MAVKRRTVAIAGALGVALGMLALVDRPERASTGMVVVAGPATTPEAVPARPVAAPAVASLDVGAPAEEATAAQASAAPANYTYWEGGDPGVWGTPATFSTAR